MSDFDKHPGGGFTSVGGYHDPAGSQAEADRLAREAEEARRRQDQAFADAAALEREREHRARESDRAQQSRENARQAPRREEPATPAGKRGSETRAGAGEAPAAPWRITGLGRALGLLAFVAVGAAAAFEVGGEHAWIAALALGLPAGYLAARYPTHLLALLVLGVGAWIWYRVDPPAGASAEDVFATAPIQQSNTVPMALGAETARDAAPALLDAPVAAAPPATSVPVATTDTAIAAPTEPPLYIGPAGPPYVTQPAPSAPPIAYADDMAPTPSTSAPLFARDASLELDFAETRANGRLVSHIRHGSAVDYRRIERVGFEVRRGTLLAYESDGDWTALMDSDDERLHALQSRLRMSREPHSLRMHGPDGAVSTDLPVIYLSEPDG